MLDPDQQLQNYRTTLKDGRNVANEAEAFEYMNSTLKAVRELHRRNPDLDLSRLHSALDRLAHNPNAVLRTEAERTRIALGMQ